MANRSYLYSINEIPTGTRNPDTKIIGLSEFDYSVPVVYKVLLSGSPQTTHSIIFDGNIGITGNYKKGLENLRRYLSSLKKENIPNKDKFTEYSDKAIRFLEDKENMQKFFQLEIGEIMEMDDEDYYSNTMKSIKELEEMFNRVSGDTLPAYEIDIYNWEKELGIDYWSNILYHDFSQEDKK